MVSVWDRLTLVRRLGFFAMPAVSPERWRARYVGARGQVIVAAGLEREIRVWIERGRGEDPSPAVLTVARAVPNDALEVVLRPAIDEVRRAQR